MAIFYNFYTATRRAAFDIAPRRAYNFNCPGIRRLQYTAMFLPPCAGVYIIREPLYAGAYPRRAAPIQRKHIMETVKVKLNENFITLPIAHRGLHSAEVSENSMEAFRLAIEKGYAIEIDVHLTLDGNLAVIHDSFLSRVTGKSGIVEQLTTNKLKDYRLKDGQPIPMLSDVLELVNGRVPLLIELKFRRTFNERQADVLLMQLKDYPKKQFIALQSFHPKAVRYLKEHTDEYSVGYLSSYKLVRTHRFVNYVLLSLKLFKYMHADFISYDVNYLPNKYVASKKKRGVQVLAWTVNSEEKKRRALAAADNIIFEHILPERR